MSRILRALNSRESMLAASTLGLGAAATVLVVLAMASCQTGLGSGGAAGGSRPDQTANRPRALPNPPAIPAPARAPGEPEVRVRVMTAVDGLRVSAPGGVIIARADPRGTSLPSGQTMNPDARTAPGAMVNITVRSGQWTIQEPDRAPVPVPASAALTLAPARAGEVLTVSKGGPGVVLGTLAQYPGVLRCSARTDVRDGAFDVVEFVGIESYLPGVVAKEMLAGWPPGAFQAQAVAARSYALHERNRSIALNQPYDLESSDSDQVYGGTTTNRVAQEAVASTRGVVLMDGDKVLRAYYSSTCGGRTASARDVWPTGPGYEFNLAGPIQASPRMSACDQSPLYRWTVERSRKELIARLRAFGERNQVIIRQIKDLKSVEVLALNADGRPSKYKLIEPSGKWYALSAEELRVACNTSVDASIPARSPSDRSPTDRSPATALASAPATNAASAPTPLVSVVQTGPESAGSSTRSFPDVDRKTRVLSGDFEMRINGDRVVITGRGFGHGVGLCQYCARAFGERGEDWRLMLDRFYPGARLVVQY